MKAVIPRLNRKARLGGIPADYEIEVLLIDIGGDGWDRFLTFKIGKVSLA